jgi:hypothetical protein
VALVLTADRIYYVEEGGGANDVRVIPKTGGIPGTVLAHLNLDGPALAVEGRTLFCNEVLQNTPFGSFGSIVFDVDAPDAGTATRLYTPAVSPGGSLGQLSAQGADLLFVQLPFNLTVPSYVYARPLGGGAVVKVGETAPGHGIIGLIADDQDVFFFDYAEVAGPTSTEAGRLMRLARGGGTPLALTEPADMGLDVHFQLDEGYVYWSGYPEGLLRADRHGTPPITPQKLPAVTSNRFVVDAGFVYFADSSGIERLSTAKGTQPQTLWAISNASSVFGLDADYVYFVTSSGSIARVLR